MILERAADNLVMATEIQLMQLNGGTHISVSVPANTKIYVVWTQHRKGPENGQRHRKSQHSTVDSTQEHVSSPAGTGRVSFCYRTS